MADTERNSKRHSKWLRQQNFYHGFIPREDLLYILKRQGDYIVRTTDRPTAKGRQRDLVLSVAWPEGSGPLTSGDIRNIVIKKNQKGQFCLDKIDKFETLENLLDFYHTYPIKMKASDGKVRLLRAIPLLPWEYRNNQISLQKKVGQGAYGEVYKGKVKRSKNGKTFEAAIKTMKGDVGANDEKMKEVMGEARLMRSLNHPNIVRIRGIAVMEQPYYIIIDFINGGGLDSYLRKRKNKITIEEKNKMAISAAWGIDFIHAQNIIHRDIAARNCLYDSKNYVKLSDFGLSRKGPEYKMKTARRMPTKWLAPESLRTFTFYRASDVFTYGLLLYEIYTVKEPYDDLNGAEARKRTMSGEYPNFEKEAPPELYPIVTRMIYIPDHEKRATMTQVVKALEEWLQVELVINEQEDLEKSMLPEDEGVVEESLVPRNLVHAEKVTPTVEPKVEEPSAVSNIQAPVEEEQVTTFAAVAEQQPISINAVTNEDQVTHVVSCSPAQEERKISSGISPAEEKMTSPAGAQDESPIQNTIQVKVRNNGNPGDEEKAESKSVSSVSDGESGLFEKSRPKKKNSSDDARTATKSSDCENSMFQKIGTKQGKTDEEKTAAKISDGEKSVFESSGAKKKINMDGEKTAAKLSAVEPRIPKEKKDDDIDDVKTAAQTSDRESKVGTPEARNKLIVDDEKTATRISDAEKSVFVKREVKKKPSPSERKKKKISGDEEKTAAVLDGEGGLFEKSRAKKKNGSDEEKTAVKLPDDEEKPSKPTKSDGESGRFEKTRSKRKTRMDDTRMASKLSEDDKKMSRMLDGESGRFEKARAKKKTESSDEKPPSRRTDGESGRFEKADGRNTGYRKSERKRNKK